MLGGGGVGLIYRQVLSTIIINLKRIDLLVDFFALT